MLAAYARVLSNHQPKSQPCAVSLERLLARMSLCAVSIRVSLENPASLGTQSNDCWQRDPGEENKWGRKQVLDRTQENK